MKLTRIKRRAHYTYWMNKVIKSNDTSRQNFGIGFAAGFGAMGLLIQIGFLLGWIK